MTRGICPACGKDLKINKDGTLHGHKCIDAEQNQHEQSEFQIAVNQNAVAENVQNADETTEQNDGDVVAAFQQLGVADSQVELPSDSECLPDQTPESMTNEAIEALRGVSQAFAEAILTEVSVPAKNPGDTENSSIVTGELSIGGMTYEDAADNKDVFAATIAALVGFSDVEVTITEVDSAIIVNYCVKAPEKTPLGVPCADSACTKIEKLSRKTRETPAWMRKHFPIGCEIESRKHFLLLVLSLLDAKKLKKLISSDVRVLSLCAQTNVLWQPLCIELWETYAHPRRSQDLQDDYYECESWKTAYTETEPEITDMINLREKYDDEDLDDLDYSRVSELLDGNDLPPERNDDPEDTPAYYFSEEYLRENHPNDFDYDD